jgi:NAD(P)-dependent dehydrogenase (short-subunit alcohol dehydrogenase family)
MVATGELAKESIRVRGKVNVLVNNAGLCGRGMITGIPEETIDALLNVNLNGIILYVKIFVLF